MEKYIQPFIKVCEKVFRDFCKTEVKAGRIYFVTKDEYLARWDISGIIGLSGEASGAVAISLKDATAIKITELMTGTEHTSLDAEVTDVMGEIINIITGNVKKYIEDEFRVKISLPAIVKGEAHSIIWPFEKTRIICIPFTVFSNQEFCLSIAVEPSE
jgi:chemotaxis protein CheX